MGNSDRVSRNNAAKLVNDIFSTFLEDTAAERFDEQTRALTAAGQTGNIGSYLPALTDVVCGQLNRSIGNLAKTYVKEFTRFGIPCDPETELDLEHNARLVAGPAAGIIRHRLELLERRTRKHLNIPAGLGYVQRQIASSMNTAVKKGKIRLRRQRIELDVPLNISVSQSQRHPRSQCQSKEAVMRVFPEQDYPKSMHHATNAPGIVYSPQEQAALGQEWSEVYIHQAYPSCRYGWNNKMITVNSEEKDAVLGIGRVKTPAAFQPYLGSRPRKRSDQDETKWVDACAIHGLSLDHRKKIKAKLMRVDAEFWRSPDANGADLNAMRRAFNGIAEVLSMAGLLTEGLVQQQIQELVWDSAIAGGWYRYAGEKQDNIFPERQGNYWVWRDEGFDWEGLFHSETKAWLAWLLENAVQPNSNPVKGSEAKHEVDADSGNAEAGPTRSPKELVDDCRLRPPRRSYEKLAGKIGLSKDTLYAITKETRWVSDETYQVVAGICGCKPEDLHPRDIPRPERRRS
jgi:hypothetical protein